ncbi:MAG: acetyl-CoA carboxylase biotin carboxylase subunit, partial [Elusimicrobiota bacterium]|nr:acetyl-CoA carboxylase biotin carboxylase subunit [Elusimicrobiota bacterium]
LYYLASGLEKNATAVAESNGFHFVDLRVTYNKDLRKPEKDFIPSPGKIESVIFPGGPGVRLDTHIYNGYTVPSAYDSLIAKLLVIDSTREKAIARMQRALSEFEIAGIKTTIPFHKTTLANDYFKKGEIYTNFIQKRIYNEK